MKTADPQYRCPSINPLDADDRCKLSDDHDVDDYSHEGLYKGRPVLWDYSPIAISDDTPERWEVVVDA